MDVLLRTIITPPSLRAFLSMGPQELRELADAGARAVAVWPGFEVTTLDSLVRVLERQGLRTVGELGEAAATAWGARLGIKSRSAETP